MDAQLRILRVIHAAMVAGTILYVVIAQTVIRVEGKTVSPIIYFAVAVLAAVMVGLIFVARQAWLSSAVEALQMRPDDAAASMRWRTAYIVIFALCEATVLYGFVLRVLGATLAQVVPFYAAGILLLLLFSPRKP